jgi:hypothetical protein
MRIAIIFQNKYCVAIIIGATIIMIALSDPSPYLMLLFIAYMFAYVIYSFKNKGKYRFLNIPILVFLAIAFVIFLGELIYPALLPRVFFRFINGQIINSEKYEIKLPFPEWVIVKINDNKTSYIIASINITIRMLIKPDNAILNNLFSECSITQETHKNYIDMCAIEYICQKENDANIYILLDDQQVLLHEYKIRSKEHRNKDYDALFNSFKKK